MRRILLLLLFVPAPQVLIGDDRPPELAKAVAEFNESRTSAQGALLNGFDLAIDQLAQQRVRVEDRLKLIDVVKEEKERYEKKGLIPWSKPMWPYLAAYRKNMLAAESKLKRAYESAIDSALRSKAMDRANQLKSDLDSVLGPTVIAIWEHSAGSYVKQSKLYSNGTTNLANGTGTWDFQDGVLIKRTPDPKGPDGVWLDRCFISADGKTYTGRNQRVNSTGKYVAE